MKKIFISSLLSIILLAIYLPIQAKLLSSNEILATAIKEIIHINTLELKQLIKDKPNMLLIDVRTDKEVDAIGTIKAPQNLVINRGSLEFRIDEYAQDKNTLIVVYDETNLRSPLAAKTLQDMGYKNVKNYQDSYQTWQKQGLPIDKTDKAPNSMLYSLPVKVVNGVWSAIGATQPASYQNGGHNNNLSFIVGKKSVLVFNAGGSYFLAKAMHDEIKKITNKPVKYVALENGQGHAMLGSSYWKEQGASIIAHELIIKNINTHQEQVFNRNKQLLKEKFNHTKIILPNQTFIDSLILDLGGLIVKLLHLGASHSPEDIQLWIPSKRLLITGDSAFNERMLPILSHTDTQSWLETWDKLVALKADIIIPGHGVPTDIKTLTYFTKNYLIYMRKQVEQILDNDGDLTDAYNIDQSAFKGWDVYYELHLQNASRLYQKMEFE